MLSTINNTDSAELHIKVQFSVYYCYALLTAVSCHVMLLLLYYIILFVGWLISSLK